MLGCYDTAAYFVWILPGVYAGYTGEELQKELGTADCRIFFARSVTSAYGRDGVTVYDYLVHCHVETGFPVSDIFSFGKNGYLQCSYQRMVFGSLCRLYVNGRLYDTPCIRQDDTGQRAFPGAAVVYIFYTGKRFGACV